jgi:hypothetical protein
VNSHFHNDVPDPLRFTLGGPLSLSASSIDEYRATDVYLARAGYLRRIAVLPAGFGQRIYATVAYEVGDAWSVQTHNTFRQDGLAAVVAATPFGVSRSLALLATRAGERSSSASEGYCRARGVWDRTYGEYVIPIC